MSQAGLNTFGDLKAWRGQAFTFEHEFTDDNGLPINMAGHTLIYSVGPADEPDQSLFKPIEAEMTIAGAVASSPITTEQSIAIYAGQQNDIRMSHQITETLGGGNVVFHFGPRLFEISYARNSIAGTPALNLGLPSVRYSAPLGRGVARVSSFGTPGISQFQLMGFGSAAAYDADILSRAVAAVLASIGTKPSGG